MVSKVERVLVFPTYIDGWHYFYLNFWKLNIGLPKYRYRDRLFFLFARFCYTDTVAVYPYHVIYEGSKKYFTEYKEAVDFAERNSLEIITKFEKVDTGRRICYGFNYPKFRREGATYKAECINYEIISRTRQATGGIQSMTDDSAKSAFSEKLISPWKKLPFFFKPLYEGTTDPKEKLSFNPPAKRMSNSGSPINIEIGLESKIDYGPADRNYYDGQTLHFYHDDETGKVIGENCDERHNVTKICMSKGNEIIGFTIKTSTVGEMVRRGGKNFFELCSKSHYEKRNMNGTTVSGLYNLFIPSYINLTGFTDKHGNPVIDTPTAEQKEYIKNDIGAKEYIERERIAKRPNPDDYSEYVRLFPISFRECFRTSSKDTGFNLEIIENRIDELKFDRQATVTGNFIRENPNDKDSRVQWVPCSNGKFKSSLVLPPEETNLKFKKGNNWFPSKPTRFDGCADPFKFLKTEGYRKSNGGGSWFYNRDYVIDPEGRDVSEWLTNRFILTYSNRTHDKNEYCEDMLMACIYLGSMMFPEINVSLIWDYFVERGYAGYLKYAYKTGTKIFRETPGFNSGSGTKQDLFGEMMQYIKIHGMRERHIEILEECQDIAGIEDMTNYDLFTAAGGCLLSVRSGYNKIIEGHNQSQDIGRYLGYGVSM
jgi:hypothetical protein